MSDEANRAWKAQYMLRLPEGLRDRIKAAADRQGRTMNAEIVRVLERDYPAPSDVMHVHADNIRHALDIYEKTTDPKERLRLQMLVEMMVTTGHDLQIDYGDFGEGEEGDF